MWVGITGSGADEGARDQVPDHHWRGQAQVTIGGREGI